MRYEIFLEEIKALSPDVSRLRFNRPDGLDPQPGQATDLALVRDGWRDETRPFTFTNLPDDPYLEFVIKSYPDHDGVTEQIPHLAPGASVTIGDPWGAISDQGPGVFLAGGAGVTPFIPILRKRARNGTLEGCTLVLADSGWDRLIVRDDWRQMDSLETHFVLSDESREGCHHGHIDEDLLRKLKVSSGTRIYLCGPPPMQDALFDTLSNLGVADSDIVKED